ncbi:MAG: dihydroneopterin aldolase [Dysgonamonadaceae bacterium]|jgi:dihydroneopterin aldolase|nr:dihydroneopterin aldolase [Dysgonamonadaceae bacterium]
MDCIELKNMVFHARHGVLEQEKTVGNTFTVSLKLYLDLSIAGQTDNLKDTLNYADVFEIVKREMAIPSGLLEHVATRIISAVEQAFPQIINIRIRLAKVRPPVNGEVEEVAVITSRKRYRHICRK